MLGGVKLGCGGGGRQCIDMVFVYLERERERELIVVVIIIIMLLFSSFLRLPWSVSLQVHVILGRHQVPGLA